jgi:hypothetical protein
MTTAQQTDALTRDECRELIGRSPAGRLGSVSIAGAPPTQLTCLLLPTGDVLIPTGGDRDLVRSASGRIVTVQFEQSARDERSGWIVRGTGQARPTGRRERMPASSTASALAMLYAFENGIRVSLKEVTGHRTALDT